MCLAFMVILNIGPVFTSLDISLRLRFLASLLKFEAVVIYLEQTEDRLGDAVPITPPLFLANQTVCFACWLPVSIRASSFRNSPLVNLVLCWIYES